MAYRKTKTVTVEAIDDDRLTGDCWAKLVGAGYIDDNVGVVLVQLTPFCPRCAQQGHDEPDCHVLCDE